ncbi:MAG: hypothetical protein ACI9UJ_001934 [bacterium]|jgi:uncharacterized protein YbaP (TraB family)
MKKLLAFGLAFCAVATSAQNSLLFEIKGNGLDKPSYLFGTMHVQDEAAFGWNDSVFWAINQTEVSAFELDFDGKELKNDIKPSKSQKKEWEDFLANDLSPAIEKTIPADTLGLRISGFYTEILKTLLTKDKDKRGTYVDLFLKEYAEKNGKEIVGIESIKEQLNVFLDMDKQLVKKSIIGFLEADNWNFDVDMMTGQQSGLIEAYGTKRLSDVCTVLTEITSASSNELVNELYGRVFEDRNAIMIKRTSKMIKDKPHFIAVGAGHLCGSTGLVQQLQKAGYTVRPIDIITMTNQNVEWQTFETENYTIQVPKGVEGIDPSANEYAQYLSGNPHATVYTTKGKAEFSIELLSNAYYEEAEEAYEYYEIEEEVEMATDSEYDSEYDVVEEVEDDVEEDVPYKAYDYYGNEEEVIERDYEEKGPGGYEPEVEVEEEIESEVVAYEEYTDREESIGEESIGEEATESVEEMEYDEQTEIEEDYGSYEGENDYDDYSGSSKKRNDKSSSKKDQPFKSEYWTTVTKTVMSQAMGEIMGEAFKLEGKEKPADEPQVEQITVMGNSEKLVSETTYSGYNKSVVIKTDNGSYELKITGDVLLLNSRELDAFFTSFQLK